MSLRVYKMMSLILMKYAGNGNNVNSSKLQVVCTSELWQRNERTSKQTTISERIRHNQNEPQDFRGYMSLVYATGFKILLRNINLQGVTDLSIGLLHAPRLRWSYLRIVFKTLSLPLNHIYISNTTRSPYISIYTFTYNPPLSLELTTLEPFPKPKPTIKHTN